MKMGPGLPIGFRCQLRLADLRDGGWGELVDLVADPSEHPGRLASDE